MQYLVVVEKADTNYSAYAPDVPGCAATGDTIEETIEPFARSATGSLGGNDAGS